MLILIKWTIYYDEKSNNVVLRQLNQIKIQRKNNQIYKPLI